MGKKITDYIEIDKLEAYKKSLKQNEIKDIYEDENIIISICKKGRKIYTIINEFGNKKINIALNEMYSLV